MEDGRDGEELTPGRLLIGFTRVWLPLLIAALGIVLILIGGGIYHGNLSHLGSTHVDEYSAASGAGVALLIVALIVWMINWLYRLGVSSNLDREQEEHAREYFDATGRWPEDET